MPTIKVSGFGNVKSSSKRFTKLIIDTSTADISIGDDVYKALSQIQIKHLYSYTDKFDSKRFRESNEYSMRQRDVSYIQSLKETKFYFGVVIDEMFVQDVEDVFSMNMYKTIWYEFFKWFLSRRTTKHLIVVSLQNKYKTNFMGGYIDLLGKERPSTVFDTATIHYLKFDEQNFISIKNNLKVNDFYKYINDVFIELFKNHSTIDLEQALSRIPTSRLTGISYRVGIRPKNPILLDNLDSNNSSKGGVGGYLSKMDRVEQKKCSTCNLSNFECPNHITYVKSKYPLFNFGPLDVAMDEYRNTYNSVISWLYLTFLKKHKIETFIYNQDPFNIRNTCTIFVNGKVYSKDRSLFKNNDKISVSKGTYLTRDELYNNVIDLLRSSKIRRWAEKYKIIDVLRKCRTYLIPILPPRLYRTPASDGNNLHKNYTNFMKDNRNVSEVENAMFKPAEHTMSIMGMLREKHQHLENNLSVRRFNSSRRILGGSSHIHPSEVIVPGYICDTQSMVVPVTKSNMINLSNSRLNYIIRNGMKIKGNNPRPGDIAYRKIIDGIDVGVLNRQPSLDENALYAGKIRRTNDSSVTAIQIPNYTAPRLQADYDGDELNLHLPSTLLGSEVLYKQLGIEHRPLTTLNNKATVGLHMDSHLFMYIISSQDKFEFPIPNMMFPQSKRSIISVDKSRKYENREYEKSGPYQIVQRFIMDYKDIDFDISKINSPTVEQKKMDTLISSFQRLSPLNFPFKEYFFNLGYDTRVKYLRNCVGFIRMTGYEMLHFLFSSFEDIDVDETKRYGKNDFEYVSENIVTEMFRKYESTLVMDWLWIVSNLSSMFLTHNTQYSSLKIEDILSDHNMMPEFEAIERELYDSKSGSQLTRKYDEVTKPKITIHDMKLRNEFFQGVSKQFQDIIDVANIPENNTLYNQAKSGSKGNVGKFNTLYYSWGGLINPETILPNSLTDQVNCHDDYYDISRYGFLKNSTAGGYSPREYYHQLSMMHIALQQTPLATKESGKVEKRLTPTLQDLYIRDGKLENAHKRLLPWLY